MFYYLKSVDPLGGSFFQIDPQIKLFFPLQISTKMQVSLLEGSMHTAAVGSP